MMTLQVVPGTPRPHPLRASIVCDGPVYSGSLGLLCSEPVSVIAATGDAAFAPDAVREAARRVGWRRVMWDHARYGEAWLCPGCQG